MPLAHDLKNGHLTNNSTQKEARMSDIFDTLDTFTSGDKTYRYYSLPKLAEQFEAVKRLPYCMKIVLENMLRNEDGGESVGKPHIEAVASFTGQPSDQEIAFTPTRVVLQDFTGVPSVVDLAAMRDAIVKLGGEASQINPFIPSELVVDHSVQVDVYGKAEALDLNSKIEFERNNERYEFLHWGKKAFENFKVVPPSTGIVHQVNLEYLGRVVMTGDIEGEKFAYPDTVFGTDSHTTMINGLGVLGWGVGGIEAEAAMLGQPSSMLIPEVVGVEMTGKLPAGVTATDLVLTVTEMLRKHGVVNKFVEFFGDGLSHLPLADRATLGNMSPEFGSTCAIFPVDQITLDYLKLSNRDPEQIQLIEDYARAQGLWREDGAPKANYSVKLELDMSTVVPSVAGPKLPHQRINVPDLKKSFNDTLSQMANVDRSEALSRYNYEGGDQPQADELASSPVAKFQINGEETQITDGSVVIAAITSCTNTSNPAVMMAAGLVAKNAAAKGLKAKPWVKTSLAPGSKVVTDYLEKTQLMDALEAVGFYLVGYGCTTCIGNSGPLPKEVEQAIEDHDLVVSSVLSGNRNFEGRIHSHVKTNYLASPPLVVAYALAGTAHIDLTNDPLGQDQDGNDVYLKDIWPSSEEVANLVQETVTSKMFSDNYDDVFRGSDEWRAIKSPDDARYQWNADSTYIENPPFFEGMTLDEPGIKDLSDARVLGLYGDSITTDHISPAGNIPADSPAGKYLIDHGVQEADFNSYGSRRGNDQVMTRGTFANIRIKNQMLDGVEGGYTKVFTSDDQTLADAEQTTIFEAAMQYKDEGRTLVVIGGAEYGTGSSRDWAAKGTILLGVKAVIAQSYERIHRANLVGMGVLPLTFKEGESAKSHGLTGAERISISGLKDGASKTAQVEAISPDGSKTTFEVIVKLNTPKEVTYVRHGGVLHYVLRDMAKKAA